MSSADARVRRVSGCSPEDIDHLLAEYKLTRDRRIRNQIVVANLHIVDHYVMRYSRSGRVSPEDLRQTALLAVIGAVERFDETAGASLRTFASRTIEGELKRYLRDKTWIVRPPRSHQEAHLSIRRATEELTQSLHRSPTVAELSAHLGLDEERVIQGLAAAEVRASESINRQIRHGQSDDGAGELGDIDGGFDLSELRMALRSGISSLNEREQHVLRLRFLDELSQPEISELIGVSQSYVSRIIRDALLKLRNCIDATE
ncbi:MAG TPA: sigma-70 family RNA polymerase sigma factor [Microthrixaceae bacterium]|nr:sigma-70 family RNA polymerase sigma factor [Microthrixaceae bacterium]